MHQCLRERPGFGSEISYVTVVRTAERHYTVFFGFPFVVALREVVILNLLQALSKLTPTCHRPTPHKNLINSYEPLLDSRAPHKQKAL